MGAICVDVTIRGPANPRRSWTGKFLVDTGTFDSLVPRSNLEAIGLKPRGRREYVLADGKPVSLDITIAEIELEGEVVGGTILFGDEGAEPLLGVTALESGGFEVDPRNEELKQINDGDGVASLPVRGRGLKLAWLGLIVIGVRRSPCGAWIETLL